MSTVKDRIRKALTEAVSVSHDRYMRSHGKKASGRVGHAMWMFTTKGYGDPAKTEIFTFRGLLADASKEAKAWAKKHGFTTVYVMEETELDEAKGMSKEQKAKITSWQKEKIPELEKKGYEFWKYDDKSGSYHMIKGKETVQITAGGALGYGKKK